MRIARPFVAMAAALCLVLSGCSSVATPSLSSTPATPIIGLSAGDCTEAIDFARDTIASIRVTGCDSSHQHEVAAVITLPQGEYPGKVALGDYAKVECTSAFTDYVGVAPEYSRYSLAYVAPNESLWNTSQDRVLACLVGSISGDKTGSSKGDVSLFPKKGECTGSQDVTSVAVEILSCDIPHSYEVFAEKEITAEKPLSLEKTNELVNEVCFKGFKKYVGIAPTKSKYDYRWFIAGVDVWSQVKDHRLVCSAGLDNKNITGSLKGIKK